MLSFICLFPDCGSSHCCCSKDWPLPPSLCPTAASSGDRVGLQPGLEEFSAGRAMVTTEPRSDSTRTTRLWLSKWLAGGARQHSQAPRWSWWVSGPTWILENQEAGGVTLFGFCRDVSVTSQPSPFLLIWILTSLVTPTLYWFALLPSISSLCSPPSCLALQPQ